MKKVWVNGTFDILHIGHIKLLEFAKAQGDFLFVGIDSDYRVKLRKGPGRPINDENVRMEFLNALKFVDRVAIFSSDSELSSLIKAFDPDIFVIGSDYKNKKIIGARYARKIIYFDILYGYSTTNIVKSNPNTI